MADSLSFSLLLPGASPREPVEVCLWRLPFSTAGRPADSSSPSLADSCRLWRLGSRCSISFLNSAWEMSRLCLRTVATGSFLSPAAMVAGSGEEEEVVSEEANFSADWTRLRRGERGGSALLGREIWRASGGEEWSLTGKEWARAWPGSGEGERCGEVLWGVGEGVRASGDRGMLPADLRRGERYWRWSLGARPWRELGRMWPELAGELGTLELGELDWDELPPTEWAESGVER